jgi:hypothetical protein
MVGFLVTPRWVLPDRLDQAAVHNLSRRGRQRDHPDRVIVPAFTNETVPIGSITASTCAAS